MKNCSIEKIEYYLPNNTVSNDDIAGHSINWNSDKILRKTGINTRHSVSKNQTSLDIGYEAAQKVLKNYNIDLIDFIIFCTQSPDYYLPPNSCILQNKLNLPTTIGALDITHGCSGFVYGLAVAKGLIIAGIAKHVLLITAETYTKKINKLDIANRTIFGDGASACIVSICEELGLGEFDLGTDGSGMNNLIIPNGGARNAYDPYAELITESSGSKHTNNDLYMNGPDIFNFTIEAVPKTFKRILQVNNTPREDVDYFIFHQANKYMLNYLCTLCGIDKEKFYIDMLDTGNTVSSTIPIAYVKAIENKKIKFGDKVMFLGFGVGYSWGGVIITHNL
ncbi:MAG: ketoacyl-ACP synthase III [Saprospiraceae bacterium]|nr:ketoacyl-ACP synthase III [Saprospiraceae bacterium]